ncbi:hypothetical protein [Sporolactobacillus laevolacticus]|uniref:Uncharacterized protein n=1 Tax=Sporolactobacillus laevolacticus DSM 442 TaxID=1395513 RepID=V6J640_9BACL|nr:hypothetical protein [Sporolactobacillus laevolacticus]EST12234.1 hypothetical protein P343_08145 [Sporolactobacillus laevolacticus DSM 442]
MNEVMERIAELEELYKTSKRDGLGRAQCFFIGELAELKVILKRGAWVNA